jgi:hypothetical protein
VTTFAPRTLWVLLATLLAALFSPAAATASQLTLAGATVAQVTSTPPDFEAESGRAAPVLVGGEPVIWVTIGAGPYTTQFRADRISQRLHEIVRDSPAYRPPAFRVEDVTSSQAISSSGAGTPRR